MSKSKTNENFIHRCTSKQVKIAAYRRSIVESGMAQEDICEILDFFLFHAPMLKNDKKTEYSALKRLKDFGWTGNAKLLELEGKLLEAAEMEIFCILKRLKRWWRFTITADSFPGRFPAWRLCFCAP